MLDRRVDTSMEADRMPLDCIAHRRSYGSMKRMKIERALPHHSLMMNKDVGLVHPELKFNRKSGRNKN
jgi:hypothetical protein